MKLNLQLRNMSCNLKRNIVVVFPTKFSWQQALPEENQKPSRILLHGDISEHSRSCAKRPSGLQVFDADFVA